MITKLTLYFKNNLDFNTPALKLYLNFLIQINFSPPAYFFSLKSKIFF